MPFLVLHAASDSAAGKSTTVRAVQWLRGKQGLSCDVILTVEETPARDDAWLALMRVAENCFVAGPADEFQLQQLAAKCEEVGYHLPILDDILPLADLVQVLDIATEASLDDTGEDSLNDSGSAGMEPYTRILDRLFDASMALPYVTLQHLTTLGGLVSPALATWFAEAAEERFRRYGQALPEDCDAIHQLAFSKPAGATAPIGEEQPDGQVGGHGTRAHGTNTNTSSTAESIESTAHGVAVEVTAAELGINKVEAASLLEIDSPLRDRLPGFQVRPGQIEMVEAVSSALTDSHHLLVEAGTGTGKSLAYLIPAVLYAKAADDRVVVSTHTVALQDQLAHRDFPLLQTALGTDVSLAVFKGRTHYLCMRKMHQELQGLSLVSEPTETLTYMHLLVWLTRTPEGNREELAGEQSLQPIWPRIQSETESCIHKRCPFFRPCYYFRARAKANAADVVVTNHSLIFTDLKTNHRVLPKYTRLIFDEAHHVEQEATKHLGAEIHRFQTLGLIARLVRDGGKHGAVADLLQRLSGSMTPGALAVPALERIADALVGLRALSEQVFTALSGIVPAGQSDLRMTTHVTTQPAFERIQEINKQLNDHLDVLRALAEDVAERAESESDEEVAGRMLDAVGFLLDVTSRLRLLATIGDAADGWVEWIEVSGPTERRQVGVYRAPIDVSHILREQLFETKDSVVLTSATLSLAGDFQYIGKRLGLMASTDSKSPRQPADEAGVVKDTTEVAAPAPFVVRTLTVPSPFDFSTQALLCVPTDVPDLSKMRAEEAAVWLSDSIYQLARLSGGRLLALFTSHAMLRATADYIRQPLARFGIEVLAQGIDGNRTQLLRAFQAQPQSVLLGAQSFWEGIDLPGNQLTTLVIVRLPFQPPTHPVTEARNERIEATGQSAFWHQSLPDAVVRFRQGFGRLVRTVNDRGVVVVFDKRIATARYGRHFLKSVPGLQTFVGSEQDVLRKVKSFFS